MISLISDVLLCGLTAPPRRDWLARLTGPGMTPLPMAQVSPSVRNGPDQDIRRSHFINTLTGDMGVRWKTCRGR
jgi:hypothetical protein